MEPDNYKNINKLSPPFKESKEEIWQKLSSRMEEKKTKQTKIIPFIPIKWAAAVVVLMGLSVFSMLYTKTIITKNGFNEVVILPDGSEATLNAASTLSYYPIRWFLTRSVMLHGEAFFKVKKGSKFDVVSTNGTTSVLGTSFNVKDRHNKLSVFCTTGKVKVSCVKDVILTPNQGVIFSPSEEPLFHQNYNVAAWKEGKLFFSNQPLSEIAIEMEFLYGIELSLDNINPDLRFTATINKPQDVSVCIELICKTLNLEWKIDNSGQYILTEKQY